MAVRSTEAKASRPFHVEVLEQLTPLRQALRGLLVDLGSPRTPTVLQRKLGASYAICWQVFKLVRADTDLSAEAANAPSPGSLKRLLALAAERGASTEAVEGVRRAAADFNQFVQGHAEDRAAFDSMVAGVVATSTTAEQQQAQRVLVQHRRAAYRAMSHVWGVQTDMFCTMAMIRRSTPGAPVADTLWMSVQQGIRRLRTDAHVTLISYTTNPSAAAVVPPEGPFADHALDRAAAVRYGMPILPQFSSAPLPDVELVEMPNGQRNYNMVGTDVGLKSNFNCAAGYAQRDVPLMVDTDGRRLGYLSLSNHRKPVALIVMDLLVHRDSFPQLRMESMIHQIQDGPTMTQEACRKSQQFRGDERVTALGRADRVTLDELPRYQDMLRYGGGRVGWDVADFDAYRLRVPFPIMGTSARMYFYDAGGTPEPTTGAADARGDEDD